MAQFAPDYSLKKLIRFQVNNNVDSEVYNEEYKSISGELEEYERNG
jgi:site-specific DNA recombinase